MSADLTDRAIDFIRCWTYRRGIACRVARVGAGDISFTFCRCLYTPGRDRIQVEHALIVNGEQLAAAISWQGYLDLLLSSLAVALDDATLEAAGIRRQYRETLRRVKEDPHGGDPAGYGFGKLYEALAAVLTPGVGL